MTQKKKLIAVLILLTVVYLSGCTEDTNINGNDNPVKIPEIVFVDDDFDINTSGWNVDHFNSIEKGVYNVSMNGTVYVSNGVYYENILINKSINIIGEDKENTVINGNRNGDVISILNPKCSIQKLNITNAGSNSGIKVFSNQNNISNNIFYNNYYGIWVDLKTQNSVYNNVFIDNYNAIRLRSVSDSTVSNNKIYSNIYEGLYLETCLRIIVQNNSFQKSGIYISGPLSSWDSHTFNGNKVNDKPIYYYVNESGITVPSNANQVILVDCENIDIENIDFSNVTIGIQICYCSKITINGNNFESNDKKSISTYYSDNITIENNIVDNGNGISVLDSENFIITQNTISNTQTAIDIDNSNNNIINKNSISMNENGIYSSYGYDNNITNNIIFANSEYGIYLLTNSNYNTVTRNNLYENRITLRIKGSRYNNVFFNEFKDSSEKAIYICCGAAENTIYKNSFINNKRNVDYTILSVNYFYKNGYGNYWDDYVEKYPDAYQTNGIWDTPYDIPETNSQDEFPLVNPIQL